LFTDTDIPRLPTDTPNTHTFDGRVERFGHGDHDVGAKDPENVVNEKAGEKNGTDSKFLERQRGDAAQREAQTKDIVGDPVLGNGRQKKRQAVVVEDYQICLAQGADTDKCR
jgi:hypothetical protein